MKSSLRNKTYLYYKAKHMYPTITMANSEHRYHEIKTAFGIFQINLTHIVILKMIYSLKYELFICLYCVIYYPYLRDCSVVSSVIANF